MFQPIEAPFSSTLPPETVKVVPELATGEAALGHGEFAVEAQHVAARRVRGLEQPLVDLGLAVDAAGPDGHGHLGEGAVGDQVGALLRLDVAEVVHVDDLRASVVGLRQIGAVRLILASSAPRSGGSVTSRLPERSLAGRP